ncbi:hypothetical protein [Streptomyces alkaliphilus]|uniref:hypothetical protein n=1 Tax=Streptomyces alkaliphilus TaxID=1472722 RepID=UPI00117E62DD|nr:hypothetical protein [Streptomyces alkaliphilus]MQS05760.1 hypothetical protein [Streptomyces alkaliphilus]
MLRAGHTVGVGGVTVLLAAALLFVGEERASAQLCTDEDKILVDLGGDSVEYRCPITGPGGAGGPGTGGGGAASACDLALVEVKGRKDASTSRFCEGVYACFINFPSTVYPDPEDWPEGQPTEDSVYTYKACYGPDGARAYGDWGWFVPDEPSVEQLAWQAYGRLVLPEFSLAFNPPEQAVIFVDTWWWAEGASRDPLRGTSAGGVVAIAEPNRMEVDPGDGSGVLGCPFVVNESKGCSHAYTKASTRGTAAAANGSAAYPARARLLYNVRFENNGTPLNLPGLPETIETEWVETPVPVTEIQAVVVE